MYDLYIAELEIDLFVAFCYFYTCTASLRKAYVMYSCSKSFEIIEIGTKLKAHMQLPISLQL